MFYKIIPNFKNIYEMLGPCNKSTTSIFTNYTKVSFTFIQRNSSDAVSLISCCHTYNCRVFSPCGVPDTPQTSTQ